jgi:methionine-rich copper-binding protein CopC
MRGSPRVAAVAALLAAAVVLGTALPAQAHNYLVSSTPADGSTLTTLPDAFSVTTNEPLLDLSGDGSGFAIEVAGPDGLYYGDGCYTVSNATLSGGASLGPAGDYRMLWQLVSADGHTVSGELGFTWAPAAGTEAAAGATTPPNCGGAAIAAPGSTSPPRADANLGDVLWIGGAILAVILAAGVAMLIIARRRKA